METEDTTRIVDWPVLQRTPSDCGVACLAMAAGITYARAAYIFEHLGLTKKRKGRPVFSSNFRDLQRALAILGRPCRLRRFSTWDAVQGPAIIKVDNGTRYNWHWVYATRTEEQGLMLLDPLGWRHVERCSNPLDNHPLNQWMPKGKWISLIP